MEDSNEPTVGTKRHADDSAAGAAEDTNKAGQDTSQPPPAKKPSPVPQQPTAAQAALQRQIQQQLQEQLQQQLQAAAARGQQAHITPAQIQAQAAAMVQAAAQAQAVVAAAKARSPNNQLQPMSSSQIAALSQIQAAAIVNSRRNTAAAAAAASPDKSKVEAMTPAQIQTQIQIQAQALIHAHTQAQIQAGIYKGDDTTTAVAAKTAATVPPASAVSTNNAKPAAIPAAVSKPQTQTTVAQNHPNATASNSVSTTVNATAQPLQNAVSASSMGAVASLGTSSTMGNSNSMLLDHNNHNQMMDLSASHDSNSPAFQQQLKDALQEFWTQASQQIQNLQNQTEQDFKTHNDLPLARIKRIMKSDEDVRMISAEAPVLFAKACELFILDLSVRSWNYSQLHKRRTLQREDVKEAIQKTEIFDFLVDVIQ